MKIDIRCDGLEALKATKRFEYKLTIGIAYYDIILVPHHIIKGITIKPTFNHVRGHRDLESVVLDN